MNKKNCKRVFVFVLAMLIASCSFFVLGGCGRNKNSTGSDESVDVTKTQLYVGFYYSGLGKEWIQEVKTLFEEKYADYSFETGKKGVQVRLDLDKAGLNGGSLLETIASKRDQVFFIENSNIYDFIDRGLVKDITDVVKGTADGESVTIESKLVDRAKDYFDINGKYYALPYAEAYVGLNYNIDLFNDKGYYFAKNKSAEGFDWDDGDLETLFVQNADSEKSMGPDNIAGTSDDGLPATYSDFKALLMYIRSNGDTPLIWCGNYLTYLIEFMNALWTDFEGYDQMLLNWTMSGTATDLINVDSNGNVTKLGNTAINGSTTGWMLQQQEGKYRALDFAKICVENSDNYFVDSFSSSLTHTDAQRRFVKGGTGGYENIAMLIDGNWWEVEASSQFDESGANSKNNRNFGFMPIPKYNASKLGEDRTLLTLNNSMTFINANTADELLPAAKMFMSFAHSDVALNVFSKHCNMLRPFSYTITNDTLSQMSTYGKEMYRIHQVASSDGGNITIQDSYPLTAAAIKNTNLLNPKTWGWSVSQGYNNPFVTFKNYADISTIDYFNGLSALYKGSWGSKWIN